MIDPEYSNVKTEELDKDERQPEVKRVSVDSGCNPSEFFELRPSDQVKTVFTAMNITESGV